MQAPCKYQGSMHGGQRITGFFLSDTAVVPQALLRWLMEPPDPWKI